MTNSTTALRIEEFARQALKDAPRFGFGEVLDADAIEALTGGAYMALIAALAPSYATSTAEVREQIERILGRYSDLKDSKGKDNPELLNGLANDLRSFFN